MIIYILGLLARFETWLNGTDREKILVRRNKMRKSMFEMKGYICSGEQQAEDE